MGTMDRGSAVPATACLRLLLLLLAERSAPFVLVPYLPRTELLRRRLPALRFRHPRVASARGDPTGANAEGRFESVVSAAASVNIGGGVVSDGFKEDRDIKEERSALLLWGIATAGLDGAEAGSVLRAVASACDEIGIQFCVGGGEVVDGWRNCLPASAAVPEGVPGVTGRVVLLGVGADGGATATHEEVEADEEWLLASKYAISGKIDELRLRQPVLVELRYVRDGDSNGVGTDPPSVGELAAIIEAEVKKYSLCEPVACGPDDGLAQGEDEGDVRYVPKEWIEIDGAMVDNDDGSGSRRWDTSSVLVFDSLIDDRLRGRLLDVVLGRGGDGDSDWDDMNDGPNPRRWKRGGLLDVPDVAAEEDVILGDDGPCWGLVHDAVLDLCHGDHPAIAEFEFLLARLFPDFVVTRLPEAVLGESVSPLTANAPTAGDIFDYHIDADPNLAPPSPWTDVFGRYPNRSTSKPRFVSCLLYLNEEWDGKAWGAPTRFLDPPTGRTYDVTPRPGRCVIMDQDVSHTVVAPEGAAGRRPRYSLVWKLILHPRQVGQDCADLSGGARWPEPVFVGSAAPTSRSAANPAGAD